MKKKFEKIGFIAGEGTICRQQSYFFEDTNIDVGSAYYRLNQIDFDGSNAFSKSINVFIGLPYTCQLYPNYPNPFNSSTKIKFDIPVQTHVSISIYNALGQQLKVLCDMTKAAGHHYIEWNGLDDQDMLLPSGLYFIKMKTNNLSSAQKTIILR